MKMVLNTSPQFPPINSKTSEQFVSGGLCVLRVFVLIRRVILGSISYTGVMLPIGLIIGVLGWTIFVMLAIGVASWAMRWFPGQPWFARLVVAGFVLLGLAARHNKWAIPMIAFMVLIASGF